MREAYMTGTNRNGTFILLAWSVAIAATLGALFIGEVMGQMPCTTCWYQRIAMFPLAVLLGVAAFRNDTTVWTYALPLSLAGLAIAGYHSLLIAGIIPAPIVPCQANGPSCSGDAMSVGGIPIPYMSATAFAAISLLLLPTVRKSP
jgi:disulfide bond formation protein DsbB